MFSDEPMSMGKALLITFGSLGGVVLFMVILAFALRESYPTPIEAIAAKAEVSKDKVEMQQGYRAEYGKHVFSGIVDGQLYEATCDDIGGDCAAERFVEPVLSTPSYTPSKGPSCTKGCPCGNTCIDCSKTCRK